MTHYDLDLVRAILQGFRSPSLSDNYVGTDGLSLSPPSIVGHDPGSVPRHVDRLIELGLVQRTNEIHMRNHPDPVTLRATEEGRNWVRRAMDDRAWAESAPALKAFLSPVE